MVIPVIKTEEEALCPRSTDNLNATSKKIDNNQFDWNEQVQSYILLSFYIGYAMGNGVAGYFTDEYGARWFLFGGALLSTATTAIIPALADYTHWLWIVISRILTGLGQSTFFPGSTSLIARWIPEEQKSSIAAIVLTSFTVGTIAGNVCTGYIIQWTNTWSWVYYIYGILGFIWLLIFYFFVYSDPYKHPNLSKVEKSILAKITTPEHLKLPLKRIFSDISMWSIIIGQFGNDFTLYIIITNMPKYFKSVLNVSTHMIGTLLILPSAACFLGSVLFGLAADYGVGKLHMRKVTVRIIATIFAIPVSCIFMMLMTILQCDLIWANIFLCLAMFMKAGFYAGVGVMGMDISIHFSGILIGIASMSGGIAGMTAPYVVGLVATENTFPQWMLIHYVSTGIGVICTIPYLMFAKDERKDWDYHTNETNPYPTDNVAVCKRIWVCYRASNQVQN